ncbi:hypothetical protein [Adhaeribacter aquaticus]|uniref:transmembrane-type terpene cyclase n=1 Tax=Adhaeribacter aquaticus TaxID=299567 RepID=UPI0003FC79E8|nr:hypothetical protein [Adhaeribacter aquaticus]
MLDNPVKLNPDFAHSLMIGSGLFWTITYLLILRRGFKDKNYGMPVAALCANLSWEFIFSFVYPHPAPQLYINYTWLLFDVGILIQYFYYGRNGFPGNLPKALFYPWFVLTLVLSALTIMLMSKEFNEYIGIYAAFGQNLLMSVLFISMLLKRGSSTGQSLYIGLSKMLGTILPSVLFYNYFPQSYLLQLLYISIFIYDLAYVILLYNKLKAEGINPWKRL